MGPGMGILYESRLTETVFSRPHGKISTFHFKEREVARIADHALKAADAAFIATWVI
jgi:hypothetical protein